MRDAAEGGTPLRTLGDVIIDELIAAASGGSARATGRLLSLVESPRRDEVLDALGDVTAARVVGITGPPGAGSAAFFSAQCIQCSPGVARQNGD